AGWAHLSGNTPWPRPAGYLPRLAGRLLRPACLPRLPLPLPRARVGHRRPQPGTRHCGRHVHGPDDDRAGPCAPPVAPGSWPPSAAEVRCLFWTLRPHLKTSNIFPEFDSVLMMANWTFLTSHARVLLCIAHDPGVRLRDIAVSLGITERRAYGIVTDLAKAGYVVKQKDGRRNRYQIQAHLPLPEPTRHERTVGEVLALLAGADTRQDLTGAEP